MLSAGECVRTRCRAPSSAAAARPVFGRAAVAGGRRWQLLLARAVTGRRASVLLVGVPSGAKPRPLESRCAASRSANSAASVGGLGPFEADDDQRARACRSRDRSGRRRSRCAVASTCACVTSIAMPFASAASKSTIHARSPPSSASGSSVASQSGESSSSSGMRVAPHAEHFAAPGGIADRAPAIGQQHRARRLRERVDRVERRERRRGLHVGRRDRVDRCQHANDPGRAAAADMRDARSRTRRSASSSLCAKRALQYATPAFSSAAVGAGSWSMVLMSSG